MKLSKFQQCLVVIIITLAGLIMMRVGDKVSKRLNTVRSSIRGFAIPGGGAAPMGEGVLHGFDTIKPWDIAPEKGFSLNLSTENVREGKYSLKVVYPKASYPSINTRGLRQDWGHYAAFAFDVFNPQDETFELTTRLDDTKGKRMQVSRKVRSGWNTIKISRSLIDRKIDPARIKRVVLFLKKPKKQYTLYFDNMHLVPAADQAADEHQAGPRKAKQLAVKKPPLPTRKAVKGTAKELPRQGSLRVPVARVRDVAEQPLLISAGIPFAPGQLTDPRNIAFFDGQEQEIPLAVKILARWPQDQSIRSILVQFHYPVENIYQYVTMTWGTARGTKDGRIVEPLWAYPQGTVLMPAKWLCQSQVIGEQIPVNQRFVPRYDANIEKHFPRVRDTALTGDVRKDGFYSTAHVFYQLYVRSGELKHFLAARRELLHYRENQIILEGKHRGRSNVSTKPRYIYVDAMADDYLLTGDPRSLEVAGYMAEYIRDRYSPREAFYKKTDERFFTERRHAFPLLGLVTYYEITLDKKYLKRAEEYIQSLYKTQLQWPSRGGFIHNLYSHDPDEGARKDEYGGSPFMTGTLLEGIIKYHRLTGDETAADSIFRALDWLINEGLVATRDSFKYLTADKYLNYKGDADLNLLVAHAFGYGYKISGYQRQDYFDIGMKVFRRGVKDGYLDRRKHFNQNYRSSGHFLAYIQDALVQQEKTQAVPQPLAAVEQPDLGDVLYFEGFEQSLGRFQSPGDARLKLDSQNVYLNGKVLLAESKFMMSNLSFGVGLEQWEIEKFPRLSFAYRIPPETPVGMRVKTSLGDWICLGGTATARCGGTSAAEKWVLKDDGQWHEFEADVKEGVHSVLAKMKRLNGFQFFTQGNAENTDRFWIDDFKIRK